MNKVSGIYKITNPVGNIYIGQSKDCNARKSVYKGVHCKLQIKLYRSLIKYGWETHSFEIIHKCDIEQLNELEIYYINKFNTFNTVNGLNLRSGGNRPIWAQESRDKVGIKIKGHISIFKGIPRTDEVKRKIGDANRGRKLPPVSDEYRKKMSEIKKGNTVMIGRKHSDETKKKMSLSQMGRYGAWTGKTRSEATKLKMSSSRKEYLKRKNNLLERKY